MTLRERIREFRRQAVAAADKDIKGKHECQTRQEWAESRKRAGWTRELVDQAIGAGPLAAVREAMIEMPERPSRQLVLATRALGTIDSGRAVEPQSPRYGFDTTPLQRRTYAAARLRAL
jgi:hypothetical protein